MLLSSKSKALISLILLGFLMAPLAASAASDSGTVTVGMSALPCGITTLTISGSPGGVGSYSPTGLTGGNTVVGVWDDTGCVVRGLLDVSGFSSDPGSSWLTSITCNGVQNASSSASYGYDSSTGQAEWSWNQTFGFWSESVGTKVSCTIVHS